MSERTCPSCGTAFDPEKLKSADRVLIVGMHDNHTFRRLTGASVDAIIDDWLAQIAADLPGGPTSLCPAVVCRGKTELRRVGSMVFPDYKTRRPREPDKLEAYRATLKADPDIARILANAPNNALR